MLTLMMMMMICSRSQGKEKEAETLLKDSIRFGPHFADAYSSLASLYAEQVTHPQNTKATSLSHTDSHTYAPYMTQCLEAWCNSSPLHNS